MPFTSADAAAIEQTFGIKVDAQPRCDYASRPGGEPVALWDFVFATTPPTIAPSQVITNVQIAGKNHRVWTTSASYSAGLEIY